MKLAIDWSRGWWKVLRRFQWFIIGLIVVLAILRAVLPFVVERYVNRQLNRAHDYGGHIGSVHIQLWRGRYRINNLQIYKRSGGVQVPLFAADQMYLAIEWKELFHGSIVGQVIINRPQLNFVSGPTSEQTQTGKDEGWGDMLGSLFPFDLNRLEILNGQIHFQNEHSTPPVDIYVNQLSATATNLTNSRKVKSELPAGVTAHATTVGGGGFDLQVQLNPLADAPTFQLTAQLTNVNLVALNNFLKAYGKFDVERGEFALYTSVASKDGNFDGYLKVFFEKLNVFAWEKERQKNALQIFWQAIVGTLTTVLKNHSTDSLAARIPISGSYKDQKIGAWAAVGSLLRNAFIRALIPRIDEEMTTQKVEQKVEKKAKIIGSPFPEKGAQKMTKPAG